MGLISETESSSRSYHRLCISNVFSNVALRPQWPQGRKPRSTSSFTQLLSSVHNVSSGGPCEADRIFNTKLSEVKHCSGWSRAVWNKESSLRRVLITRRAWHLWRCTSWGNVPLAANTPETTNLPLLMNQHKRHLSHHHSEKEKTDKQADAESTDKFCYLVGALSPVNHKKWGQKIYFAQLHALLKWNSLFQWL